MTVIPAYTEPVAPVVVEQPQVYEPEPIEDSQEQTSFAELLAGLLNNTEKIQSELIPSVDLANAEINLDGLPDESIGMENLELLGNISESLIVHGKNLSGAEILDEHFGALQSAENLLNRSEFNIDADADDFQQNLANLINVNNLPEVELESDFFMVDAEKNVSVSQAAAADVNPAEINIENDNDSSSKESFFTKPKNQETLSANSVNSDELKSLRKDQENERFSRVDESQNAKFNDVSNRNRRRDRVTFEVRDHRTGEVNGQNNPQVRSFAQVQASASQSLNNASSREITLELRLPDYNNSMGQNQAQTTWEAKASSALENMLARELHQNFNGDIVRHASMALRDGGEGTIKISLKPESLGNVKIRLEMTENKITGHIIVESEEALSAFRKEIASLEQAFRDFGFTSADLNLSMTADQRNAQGWEQEASSFSPQMVSSRYDEGFEGAAVVDVYFGRNQSSINLLA